MDYSYFYIILVGILFSLAIFDLIVGVSNDAVNFLNSSVASKVAPLYIIMAVASLGILMGAIFSGGMMEVARSGIFHPERFYFNEVMLIFLAVMITDIILLDLFNTFGLPTSTTVSLVFELLGAAVAISLVKIFNNPNQSILDLAGYINTSKVSAIVFSILASVIIGFVCSVIIQFLARLLFTFKLRKTLKYYGAIWSGISITILAYFILFKGMKDSTLISAETIGYISNHLPTFMLGLFACTSVLFQLLFWLFKVNPLKIVILCGTFALAMAFAGNDLVNFIGVPMAGLNSYQLFADSGIDPHSLSMEGLKGAVPAHTLILVAAGIIMTLTLWFSKKAKTVMRTEIDLSSSSEQEERFNANPISRSVVKMFVGAGHIKDKILPESWSKKIEKRFQPDKKAEQNGAAYDLLRASVNLMVASALIAFGTSLKLPLSTTYITFMVAMGSSLSDKAWGRESAVYRVSGVFTVISGWFVTAIIAFIVAMTVGFIVYFGGTIGIIIILICVAFILIKTSAIHRKKEKMTANAKNVFQVKKEDAEQIHVIGANNICNILDQLPEIYQNIAEGLETENFKKLKSIEKTVDDLGLLSKQMRTRTGEAMKLLQENMVNHVNYHLQSVNYLREMIHSLSFVAKICFEHTNNRHKPLLPEQIYEINELQKFIKEYINLMTFQMRNHDYSYMEEAQATYEKFEETVDRINKTQMKRIKKGNSGTKNSLLFLGIISNTKNMMMFGELLLKTQAQFEEYVKG